MKLTQTACDQILLSVDALFAEKMELIQRAIRAAGESKKIEKISTITSAFAEKATPLFDTRHQLNKFVEENFDFLVRYTV